MRTMSNRVCLVLVPLQSDHALVVLTALFNSAVSQLRTNHSATALTLSQVSNFTVSLS